MKPQHGLIFMVAGMALVAVYFFLRDDAVPEIAPDTQRNEVESTKKTNGSGQSILGKSDDSGNLGTVEIPSGPISDRAFLALAQNNPLAAGAYLSKTEPGEQRDERMTRLMDIWVGKDPQEAARWIGSLPEGEFFEDCDLEFATAWGDEDPKSAALWYEQKLKSDGNMGSGAAFVNAWAESDPAAAAAWITDVIPDDDEIKEELSAGLVYQWVKTDPVAASNFVAALPDGFVRGTSVINLAASWAEEDPKAAAAWLGSVALGDDHTVMGAFLGVAQSWADQDVDAAVDWAAGQSSAVVRDESMGAIAEVHAETDPARALEIASGIAETNQRNQTTINVYSLWFQESSADAKAHLQGSLDGIEDVNLKRGIYSLLFEEDPEFRNEMIDRFEGGNEPPADDPAVSEEP